MKSFVALALVALFAAASCGQVAPKNLIMDIIKQLIENNRDKLADINVARIDLKESGSVENLNIRGVETFILEQLDAKGPLSVDIKNATISLLDAIATAHLEAKNIEIPEIGLTVKGEGELDVGLNGLWATVALDLSLNGLKPVLEDFADLYIHLDAVTATVSGGIENIDEVNDKLTKLTDFLNENLVKLAEENKLTIIEIINTVLGGILLE